MLGVWFTWHLSMWYRTCCGVDCAEILVNKPAGWAFDDTGVLRDVPSDEDRSTWPKRSLIHSYQVTPLEQLCFSADVVNCVASVLADSNNTSHTTCMPNRVVLQVVEKGGFVWLWYGDNEMPTHERPPIPYVPELDDPTWKPVYGEIEFAAGHMSVFENAIDMAHIHYLHDSRCALLIILSSCYRPDHCCRLVCIITCAYPLLH